MFQLPVRRPTRNEAELLALVALALLFASWLRRGEKIAALEAAFAARPAVVDRAKTERSKDVVRGPSHKVKSVVTAPDGTKTATTTTDSGPVESHETAKGETEHRETPACAPLAAPRTRYAGVILGREGYGGTWLEGARAGLTFAGAWDLGVTYRRRAGLGLEVGYRF